MMKVGIYIRVSTREQAEEGFSIGAQTDRLTAYCKARDWMIYDTYIDPGYSGSNIDRPAMKKLILDAKNKKIDTVLVYKLDRLSRSQKDTLHLIEDIFNKNDVSFVSINENFDTSTPFGRAMVGVLSVFAQLEREQIRERSIMGKLERAKNGYYHGGAYAPIGYDYVNGELIVNEYEAMQIRKVFDLFVNHNWSITRILAYMHKNYTHKNGNWTTHMTVVGALTMSIYIGKIDYKGEVYEGRHEGIIDEEMFQKAKARYDTIRWNKKDDKQKKRIFQSKTLLSGIIMCANCGARYFAKGNYSGRGENKQYRPYYTCYSRGKTAKRFIKDPNCKNKSYAVVNLDKMIIDEILKLSYNHSEIDRIVDTAKEEPSNENEVLEMRVADIDRQLSRLLDLYQLGTIDKDGLTDRINLLNSEKENLIGELLELDNKKPRLTKDDAVSLLEGAEKILNSDDIMEKRALVHALISEILIDEENITIHWAFI